MACYCCALIVLGVVTTPPSDPSVLVGDLPPMTVGYGGEDGFPDDQLFDAQ